MKFLSGLLLFIIISIPVLAQQELISEDAKKSIEKKFPMVSSVKGYKINESSWFVEIINEWKKYELSVDAVSNNIISSKIVEEIPENLVKKLSAEYPDYTLVEFEIKNRDGKIFYEMELSKREKELEITISENGEIIEVEEN